LFAIADPPFPNYNGGPTQWGRTNKGYTKGNIRWVIDQANTVKSDRNFDLIEKIYFDMKKVLGK
jgi:hypothetical protein